MNDNILVFLKRTFRIHHMVGIGILLVIVVNAFVRPGIPISFLLLVTPVVLLYTRMEYLEIDTKQSQYRMVVYFLGMRSNKTFQSYYRIEGIQMKKSRMSKTMTSRASSSTVTYDEYDAYLLFAESEPYYLFTESTEEKLTARLEPLLMDLQVPLYN